MSLVESYIELSRVRYPVGPLICFWPLAWSYTMSAFTLSTPFPVYVVDLIHGLATIIIMHNAGCIWNDVLDRELDRQVERTKHRPIADRRVSVPGALAFLYVHLVIYLLLKQHSSNMSWMLGVFAAFPLVGLYPLMKRITYWPQAWLGVTIHLNILIAWSEWFPISTAPLTLMFGCCWWTIFYDTMYACQDRRDDLKAGAKSTALLFGANVKAALICCASIFVGCLAAAGFLNGHGIPFYCIAVVGATIHLAVQVKTLNVDDHQSCVTMFESNAWSLGAVVWVGLLTDYMLA
ncbi:4-hydroxybenzoate polyprenyl transferase [Auriscalpium vulgare]|uniref:4-hydroxybenzoate polyprenyl transferase n=1 Tax=Auriscalpium vulgare TaxID=40419 RepID=A0ACB8RFU3_9AGAM|nr:4-hydroxybenzoate polyprenyl transferase [Auriscalpium vulgare]